MEKRYVLIYFSLVLVMKIGMCDLVIFCLLQGLTHSGFLHHMTSHREYEHLDCIEMYRVSYASWIIS